jgi:hypothetical protein
MQLDSDLTLKKATDMARQSESVRKQQSLVRSDLCDSTVDAVKIKTRNQRERQSMPRPRRKSFVLLLIYGNGSNGLVGRTTFCEMSYA